MRVIRYEDISKASNVQHFTSISWDFTDNSDAGNVDGDDNVDAGNVAVDDNTNADSADNNDGNNGGVVNISVVVN